MENQVKVAAVDELPPGKGKVIHVAGRDIAVYNVEGRYHATISTLATGRHVGGPLGESASGEMAVSVSLCPMGGRFDVAVEDSPAQRHEESSIYEVVVRGDDIMLVLPAEEAPPPPHPRRTSRGARGRSRRRR